MNKATGSAACHQIEVECNGQIIRPCCAEEAENQAPVAGASAAKVMFEDRAGTAVVEGDIQIGSTAALRFRRLASTVPIFGGAAIDGLVRLYGAIVASSHRVWPDKRIPYEFGTFPAWTPNAEDHVTELVKLWNDRYGKIVELSPRKPTDYFNHLILQPSIVSDSYVGMKADGPQALNLIPDVPTSEFLHEICHAAGLYHEHSRNDRDKYIEINWCNIYADKRLHFCPYFSNGKEHKGYDFDSVMHYPPKNSYGSAETFSVTVHGVTHHGGTMPKFKPEELSPGDQEALGDLYP